MVGGVYVGGLVWFAASTVYKRQPEADSCFHRQSFVLISGCAENEGGQREDAVVPTVRPS